MSKVGSYNGVDLGAAPIASAERANMNATYKAMAQKANIQKQFASTSSPGFGLG